MAQEYSPELSLRHKKGNKRKLLYRIFNADSNKEKEEHRSHNNFKLVLVTHKKMLY